MNRGVVLLVACVIAVGCGRGGAGGSNPLSGVWSELGSSLPGGELPFELGDLDPDAAFELINLGGGAIDIAGLSESLPGALTDLLAEELGGLGADAGALQDLIGAGDLQELIDLLEGPLAMLFQPFLDLLGMGSLEDVLADLVDLLGLVEGSGGDLGGLLDELLALGGGTLGDDISCTLSGVTLSCDTLEHEIDLTPNLDAVITLFVDVSGTFTGSSGVALEVTVDAECAGADCASVMGLIPVELPFTYDVTGAF